MIFIAFVRVAIWLTFFLLVVEGIAGIIIVRRFYVLYMFKHRELEVRVAAVERRIHLLEE